MTLDKLRSIILDAYEFDHEHLYEFIFPNRFGIDERVQSPSFADGVDTSEVRVGDLPLSIGDSVVFHYDLLDHWFFNVQLERIDPVDDTLTEPMVIEKQGKLQTRKTDSG